MSLWNPGDLVRITDLEPVAYSEAADLLRHVADLIDGGNREGYHPRWRLVDASSDQRRDPTDGMTDAEMAEHNFRMTTDRAYRDLIYSERNT